MHKFRPMFHPCKWGIGYFLTWIVASTACGQTPWQASPATPAPLVLQSWPTNLTSSPLPSDTTNTEAESVNRYRSNPSQRPAMISLESAITRTYLASELAAPQARNASTERLAVTAQPLLAVTAQPLTATSSSVPTSNPTFQNQFPTASQLLPKASVAAESTSANDLLQALPFPTSPLPNAGNIAGPSESVNGLGNIPLPMGAQSTSTTSSLASFQAASPNQVNLNCSPKINSSVSSTKLVAVVGTDRVMAGDLAPIVEPIIFENRDRLRNKEDEDRARMAMVRQLLPQFIEMKTLQQEFLRDIAGNVPPKELQKKKEELMSRVSKAFYDRFVPVELFKKFQVDDLASLERKLQEKGMSLTMMKNHFIMQILAMQIEDKYVARTFEIPPDEILRYYQENMEQWQIPARVKWRQLTVRTDKQASRAEAQQKIAQMGNEIILGGKSFDAVARESSDGFTASEGGVHDWTQQGSLKSTAIDRALFNNPPRKLSEIIEDEIGFHIVEVLERESARTQDMAEIQSEIREKLSNRMRQKKLNEFRVKVVQRVPIWSLWPEDIPGSRPLASVLDDDLFPDPM